jgi:two-component system LytT family response regulator
MHSGQAHHVALQRTAGHGLKLVEGPPGPSGSHRQSPRQPVRIAIRNQGRILLINPGDVVAVVAQGNYVLLQRESGSYCLRESIAEVADKLEPYGFVRIHRSALVNRFWVEEIGPHLPGKPFVRLRNGKKFTVSRTYKRNLKSLAELWIGTDTLLRG